MPLVEIDLPSSLFEESGRQISELVHQAQVECFQVPPDDRFQVLRPRAEGELVYDPGFGGMDRRDLVVIRLTMTRGRGADEKSALCSAILHKLSSISIRADDVLICIVENGADDWAAGQVAGDLERYMNSVAGP